MSIKLENRIRVFRAEHRLSQSDLANNIGVSRKTISTIEVGRFIPSTIIALKIAKYFGVPVEEIVEGIKNGVRKVNIDTDLRMASTGSIRKHLQENPSNFDPRKFLKESTKGMMEICKARFESFGSAGQADKIKVLSLEKMFKRYESGELEPKIS